MPIPIAPTPISTPNPVTPALSPVVNEVTTPPPANNFEDQSLANRALPSPTTNAQVEKAPDTNLLTQRATAPIASAAAPPTLEASAKSFIVKSSAEANTPANDATALSSNTQSNNDKAGAIKLNDNDEADNSNNNPLGVLTEYGAPKQEVSSGWGASLPFALMLVLFLIILSVVVYIVPTLREKVATKLPLGLGKYLVNIEQVTERVSVQPQPIVYDEKTQSATLSGTVANLTDMPVADIQIEFTFARRDDIRKQEVKRIPIEPATLGPKAQGIYKFTVSTKDFQENSVTQVFSQQTAIKFRRLLPVQPADTPPSATTPSRPRTNRTASDDSVYDGTVE